MLEGHADDLRHACKRYLEEAAQTLDWLSHRLLSPAALIKHERLKLQAMQSRLLHAVRAPLERARYALMRASGCLSAHAPNVKAQRVTLREEARRMARAAATIQARRRQALTALQAQLEVLNPQRTLERGYAMVTDARGQIVRAPKQITPRSLVTVHLAEGKAQLGIASVQETLD